MLYDLKVDAAQGAACEAANDASEQVGSDVSSDTDIAARGGVGLVGCEWVIDAFECAPSRLRDLSAVRHFCDEVIEGLKLKVVREPLWYQFPQPGGVTGMYLLSESHFACHTYPEFGLATFNLYCCREIPSWPWALRLADHLSAERVDVTKLARGRIQSADGSLLTVFEAPKGVAS